MQYWTYCVQYYQYSNALCPKKTLSNVQNILKTLFRFLWSNMCLYYIFNKNRIIDVLSYSSQSNLRKNHKWTSNIYIFPSCLDIDRIKEEVRYSHSLMYCLVQCSSNARKCYYIQMMTEDVNDWQFSTFLTNWNIPPVKQ